MLIILTIHADSREFKCSPLHST